MPPYKFDNSRAWGRHYGIDFGGQGGGPPPGATLWLTPHTITNTTPGNIAGYGIGANATGNGGTCEIRDGNQFAIPDEYSIGWPIIPPRDTLCEMRWDFIGGSLPIGSMNSPIGNAFIALPPATWSFAAGNNENIFDATTFIFFWGINVIGDVIFDVSVRYHTTLLETRTGRIRLVKTA